MNTLVACTMHTPAPPSKTVRAHLYRTGNTFLFPIGVPIIFQPQTLRAEIFALQAGLGHRCAAKAPS